MILLVDSNAVCYRAFHGMKKAELSYNLKRTEVIFGFLDVLSSLADKFNPNLFVFAWDSQKRFRQDLYPPYKSKRKEIPDPELEELKKIAYPQFSEIRREVLPLIGFRNVFIQTGLEADDIIASISKKYHKYEMCIVSPDSDLYQLLTEKHSIYAYIPAQKPKMITMKDFMDKWDISPFQWAMAKAIAGDTSDDIEGIKRVGIPTAVKYIKGELPPHHQSFKNIKAGNDVIKRNMELIELPHSKTNEYTLQIDHLSLPGFLMVCEKYGFKSFLKPEELPKWRRRFKLQ